MMAADLRRDTSSAHSPPREVDSQGTATHEILFPFSCYGTLRVILESDSDGVLAVEPVTGRHGEGATSIAALRDLASAIERHHAFLREYAPDRLSDSFLEQLEFLNHD